MRIVKGIILLVVTFIIICGCEIKSEDGKINVISSEELEQNDNALMKFLEDYDYTALLTSRFNDSYSKCKIIVESYKDGELIDIQNEVVIEVKTSLDLAIRERESGKWDIKARSGNSNVTGSFDFGVEYISEEGNSEVWKYLNYQVDIKMDQPQIVGINYIDDGGSIRHKVSAFEDNIIENMYQYKYLNVMKVIFE